ncbi:MAG: TetR/AcrR family transcriptional regulator [Pseudomonadota bacterium]
MQTAPLPTAPHSSRTKVLDAALQVIRTKGYTATSVEDICAVAGVTKGSFFHHFRSKDEMAIAAIEHWNAMTGGFFEQAPYQQLVDPRDRVLGYIDFRKEILRGTLPDFTCLLGTLVQETFDTHPHLRQACNCGISAHARKVGDDIARAKALYAPGAPWDPQVLALFTQAALQGAFILAKAQGSADIAAQCVDHLRQHVASLLGADLSPGFSSVPTQGAQS